MGIQGLLPFFEKVQKNVNLRDFAGKRVAVDGNVWLHRGAFACAQELALNQPTTTFVTFFMKQVDLLLFHRVDPVIVFDGATLPIKGHTNEQRQKKRQEAKDLGNEHLRHGRLDQAKEAFQKAVSITPEMTTQVMKALAERNIKYIQAPYEADPQLTLLCKKGYVAAVISEDSDLLVHGCPTVLFKMNAYGDCTQINYNDLFSNLGNGFNFTAWNPNKFRLWCVLSGCDYLPSVPGVGLKTAYKYLNHYKTAANVIKFLRRKGKVDNPNYEDGFAKANDAFLYQYVYVPGSTSAIHLTSLPNGKTSDYYTYLGKRPAASSMAILSGSLPATTATRAIMMPKTGDKRLALAGITNTHGQSKTSTVQPSCKPKSKTQYRLVDKKILEVTHNNKENVPPWVDALYATVQQFINAPRPLPIRVAPTPPKTLSGRSPKRSCPETNLEGTNVITPSNADGLLARLNKRARTS